MTRLAGWRTIVAGRQPAPGDQQAPSDPGSRPHVRLASGQWQTGGVLTAVLLVALLHWTNDGLWFQGDAPRHATNGLFWWDLLTALPGDPLAYAVQYYARYPVIAPAAYPPLFYLLEGAAFQVIAPSPYVAKGLVLVFAGGIGLYTLAWGRRWIGERAGWAGTIVVLLPPMVSYSNAVLLNVPATALGLASLYHYRRWLETPRPRELTLTALAAVASVATYYPAAVVLFVMMVWSLVARRSKLLLQPRVLLAAAAAAIVLLPLVWSVSLLPVHLARHTPTLARLLEASTWTYYLERLPQVIGLPWILLGAAGLVWGLASPRHRRESAYLLSAGAAVWVFYTWLPSTSPRYVLLLAPLCALGAVLLLECLVGAWRRPPDGVAAVGLACLLGLAVWTAVAARVPSVRGMRDVAEFLLREAPDEAVLYDGRHDGLFGFYFRAMDPGFERRLVLGSKLLYEYALDPGFVWVDTPVAESEAEVVSLLQQRSGCRWLAIEVGPDSRLTDSQRLLRRALNRPEFELVRSFRVRGNDIVRVRLYRFLPELEPVSRVDLSFPSFGDTEFREVEPIRRRP